MNRKKIIPIAAIIAQAILLVIKYRGSEWSWWIIFSPLLAAVGYVVLVISIAVGIEGYVKLRSKIWEKRQK